MPTIKTLHVTVRDMEELVEWLSDNSLLDPDDDVVPPPTQIGFFDDAENNTGNESRQRRLERNETARTEPHGRPRKEARRP